MHFLLNVGLQLAIAQTSAKSMLFFCDVHYLLNVGLQLLLGKVLNNLVGEYPLAQTKTDLV